MHNCEVVLEVGTMPRPASTTSGIKILISEPLYRIEFFLETIPMSVILFKFTYLIIFFNSVEDPELLIKMTTSFFRILPRSP